jgi:hypothetical protein
MCEPPQEATNEDYDDDSDAGDGPEFVYEEVDALVEWGVESYGVCLIGSARATYLYGIPSTGLGLFGLLMMIILVFSFSFCSELCIKI